MSSARRALLLLVPAVSFILVSCSEDDSVSELTGPEAPGQPEVATITVSPSSVSLRPGDVIQLVVEVLDPAGLPLPDAPIEWSSSNGAIATVSSDGLVSVTGTGSATITATSQAVQGSATVSGQAQAELARLVIIDSTRLDLISDQNDLAAGRYVFRVLADPAPSIEPGDVVAGAQGGIFMRRVASISRDADVLRLETLDATWADFMRPFEATIPFTKGAGSAETPYGTLEWGPWRLTSDSSRPATAGYRTRAGVPQDPDDFDPVDFLFDNTQVCVAGGPVSACGDVDVRVVTGDFSLTGGVDATVDFTVVPPSLDEISAIIREEMSAELVLEVTGEGEVEIAVPIGPGLTRDFSIAGLSGELTIGFFFGIAGGLSGTTTIQPNFGLENSFEVGAGWTSDDGFDGIFEASGDFEAGIQVIELGDAFLKTFLGPQIRVSLNLLGGGFFAGAGADGFLRGTGELEGLLGLENWHFLFDAGTEASVGAGIEISLIGLEVSLERGFEGPSIDLVELWGTGDLDVTTVTTGKDIFPGDEYTVLVSREDPDERPEWPDVLSSPIGLNATVGFVGGDLCHEFTFLGGSPQDCDLVGTAHLVEIPVIMWNCAVDGSHPIGITVKPRNFLGAASSVSEVTASIVCRSVYEVMRDLVDELLESGEISSPAIAFKLKSVLARAEEARDQGKKRLAGNHMRVFIHIIKQHIKKRPKRITGWAHKAPPKIDRDAGMFLIERAMLVVDCYLKLVPLCSDLSPRVH